MRVFFSNLGCKLNQAELECLAREFRAAGHEVVSSLDEADLHVVNSCTVTHVAARDSRKVARRGARQRPGIRTVLTGCYASASPQQAAALAGVDLVVANDRKERLLQLVHRHFPEHRPEPSPILSEDPVPVPYVPLAFGNARAAVKVEDGCNMRCSFCIIPLTRGRQRSRPLREIRREVLELEGRGVQEVVVTGVQISSYRHGEARLHELVEDLLASTQAPRFRLTSIAPWQFDERLLGLWPEERLCRHFHFSLQSGCDATLARMRRPYRAERFAHLVESVRRRIPDVAITTDVIAGFPGETDEEFEQSLEFVARMEFARLHAFGFSARPGTAASELPDRVPTAVCKERVARLRQVGSTSAAIFGRRNLGRRASVVWEECRDGVWRGTTDNYLKVQASADVAPRADGGPPPTEVQLASMEEEGRRVALRMPDRDGPSSPHMAVMLNPAST